MYSVSSVDIIFVFTSSHILLLSYSNLQFHMGFEILSWCLLLWDLRLRYLQSNASYLVFDFALAQILQNILLYLLYLIFCCLLACLTYNIKEYFWEKASQDESNADWRQPNLFRHVKKSQSKTCSAFLFSFQKCIFE